MRKALLILLVAAFAVFVMAMSGVALATDPAGNPDPFTFTESAPENVLIPLNASVPAATKYGASAWVYKDGYDANFKFEGSYLQFQDQTGTGTTDQGGYGAGIYDWAVGKDAGPHDGYDTTSNKCKTCHAVHRATGTYRLMRVDNPEDGCNYCHIGDHKHSTRGAYYRDAALTYSANGHTMGAGKTIPDSSVKEWLTSKSLSTVDSGGLPVTVTYKAREYKPDRNKMFYWTSIRASYHNVGWLRQGPTYLTCLSCHQPHNADKLIWKPSGTDTTTTPATAISLPDGYKLLRSAPSGSTKSTNRMVAYKAMTSYVMVAAAAPAGSTTVMLKVRSGTTNLYKGDVLEFEAAGGAFDATVQADVIVPAAPGIAVGVSPATTQDLAVDNEAGLADANIVRVPNTNILPGFGTGLSAAGDGSDISQNDGAVWTDWKGGAFDPYDGSHGAPYAPRLSVWCADCHNLNIGSYETVTGGGNWRSAQMHSDRTHTVPARLECWSCHSTNMPKTDLDWEAYTGIPATAAEPGCNKCHYYSNGSAYYNEVRQEVPKSDFPHSGANTGFKLLMEDTPNNAYGVEAGTQALDGLCIKCHDLIGDKM